MIAIGLLLVIVVAVALGRGIPAGVRAAGGPRPGRSAAHDRGDRSGGGTSDGARARSAPDGLAAALDRWVGAGLISAEQRTSIESAEAAEAARTGAEMTPSSLASTGRIPLYAEALGYLGGTLAVGGVGMVVGRYWDELAAPSRFAVALVVAVAAWVGATVVPEDRDPALDRLRGVLLVASSAGVALGVAVWADGLTDSDVTIAQATSGVVALHGIALWQLRARPLQQLTALAAGSVFLGTTAHALAGDLVAGLMVWTAGAALAALAARRMIPDPIVAQVTGPVALLAGSVLAGQDAFALGAAIGVLGAAGVVALAVVPGLADPADVVPFGAMGAVLALQSIPSTLGYFSQDAAVVTGAVAMAAGALLLAAADLELVRAQRSLTVVGGGGVFSGAAIVSQQATSAAVVLGLLASVAMIGVGARPGRLTTSFLGSFGLLVYVPWAVGWFFPGEDVAALVVIVTGGLILALAVLLTRRTMRSTGEGRPAPPSL